MLLALYLGLSALDFILLTFAVTLVLFAELANTAIEVVVDLVSPEFHPLARRAKDVAAGSVLVASFGSLVMGFVSHYLFPPLETELGRSAPIAPVLPVVSFLVVVILVVLLKAYFGKGRPLVVACQWTCRGGLFGGDVGCSDSGRNGDQSACCLDRRTA